MVNLRWILVWGVGVVLPVVGRAEGVPADGAALFKRSCAMCHGTDGRAATPAAKKMGVKDLAHTQLPKEQVRAVIVDGIKGAKGAMPAFGAKFSAAELDALVAHVRGLRESENPAKP